MTVHQPGQASQIDGERDKVLLNAIVEGALDRAPIGVRGLDETLPRPTKLRYLTLQSVDNVLQLVARANVRHRPTFLGSHRSTLRPRHVARVGSCPAFVTARGRRPIQRTCTLFRTGLHRIRWRKRHKIVT